MKHCTIHAVATDKKRYLSLLLMGDEQEDMIDRYLGQSDLYVMTAPDGEAVAVAAVTRETDTCLELKNLAVAPQARRHGCGRAMIDYICRRYAGRARMLRVGTGEVPGTLRFYTRCGFRPDGRVPGFFTRHYRHPIIEAGVRLTDMVYLARPLAPVTG